MNLSILPSIDLILAPMYSGKTSEIIRRLIIYHEMELPVLYINSKKDTRSTEAFSTHNCTIGKIPFSTIKTDTLKELDVNSFSVIGIDEASFYPDLLETVLNWVETHKKIVIVAGLNGDFQRRPFGQLNDLIPYCDTITKLTPFCLKCKKEKNIVRPALFTKRICNDKDNVIIGGKESYIPVCRDCFLV